MECGANYTVSASAAPPERRVYWQVYFDTNRVIRESFGEAGYPVPEQHYHVRTVGGRRRLSTWGAPGALQAPLLGAPLRSRGAPRRCDSFTGSERPARTGIGATG